MKLRKYQKEGFDQIYMNWKTNQDILMFVLATGGGKTVTFVEVIKQSLIEGKRVMLIAHREELIMQAWNTLYRNHIYAGIIMADHPLKYDLPVQVCSIQTIARRSQLPPADVIIIDEGHHVTAENSYFKIIKKYSSAKVLMVTATPYRLSGEGFKRVHPYKETQLILNRTVRELQDEGWLVPLKYFAASVPDLSSVHLKSGDYVEEEARKAMELAPLIDSYFEHAKGKCGVTFTINVAHSINTVQRYLHAGVPTEHLDANTKQEERKRILSDFRCGLVKVISNVGIITEGFDFPDLEFVQLARPTKSLSMFLQQVGRVTRPEASILSNLFDATNEERRMAIKNSTKPHGIVLDNAGCWLDHNLPDYDHDWEKYFNGTKRTKKETEEEIEMLVYIAEDNEGKVVKTRNPKEIEGLKLIEITKEKKQLLVNLTSIKEFDKRYGMFKNMTRVNNPGYVAFNEFKEYCSKNKILMVDEIWDYLELKLIKEIQKKVDMMAENRSKSVSSYPADMYIKTVERLNNEGVSRQFFKYQKDIYNKENFQRLQEYRLTKSVA